MYECVMNEGEIGEGIYRRDIEGLEMIGCEIEVVGGEMEMVNLEKGEKMMGGGLEGMKRE